MIDEMLVIKWVEPNTLRPHEASLEIYGGDSYEDLVESIRELGVLTPLCVTPEGVIISGYRRWKAALSVGNAVVPVVYRAFASVVEEKESIIEFNRYRQKTLRQLYNEGQTLKEIEAARARERQEATQLAGKDKEGRPIYKTSVVQNFAQPKEDERKTRARVARSIGLGSGEQWRKLEYVATNKPELLDDGKMASISISRAYKNTKQIMEESQPKGEVVSPDGKFEVIVVDPPWPYQNRAEDNTHRARSQYSRKSMTIDEIKAIDIPAMDSCVLWLWTTNAFMHDAFHALEAWGLTAKTILTWVKHKFGTGDWLRGQTEHCIMAIKGKPVVNLGAQSTVIMAPLREHSRKPDEFYTMVESLCPGRKLDMFARTERDGWEYHGDEKQF